MFLLLYNLFCLLSFANSQDLKSEALGQVILKEIRDSISKEYNIKFEKVIVSAKGKNSSTKTNLSTGQAKVEKDLLKIKLLIQHKNKRNTPKADWASKKLSSNKSFIDDKQSSISKWQSFRLETISRWKDDKVRFKKDIPKYKKELIMINEAKKKNRVREHISDHLPLNFVSSAFYAPVKDQGPRATCTSFSVIRGIEILYAQKFSYKRFSEQFFYADSKPSCTPCTKKGSWAIEGLSRSMNANIPNIPLENNCPYIKKSIKNNETHFPLDRRCKDGFVKVSKFKKIWSLNEMIRSIDNNYPVVGGFKLPDNFYNNSGHVFDKKVLKISTKEHASGHALTLVGYMKLPKSLWKSQGKSCFIVANSWGEGWGKGGHSCLSQRWIERFRYSIPFISLQDITI